MGFGASAIFTKLVLVPIVDNTCSHHQFAEGVLLFLCVLLLPVFCLLLCAVMLGWAIEFWI